MLIEVPAGGFDEHKNTVLRSLSENRLEIFLGGSGRFDGKLLDEDVDGGGGQESRQRRPKADVLDAEGQ